ncbi:hypothetical protein BSKO_13501 [Bryopsis sp. KO-2023]|nr:hypothetical protein BSKO_13501 [Bryopsis sp. KO-2023]
MFRLVDSGRCRCLKGKLESCDFLQNHIGKLFNKSELSDVTIIAPDERKIYCHRAILSVCSKPFARMLSSEMAEGRAREIRIKQVDPRALELMVQFFYTGEIDIREDDIVPLMAVSDRFDVPELVDTCRQYFETEVFLTTENVWSTLIRSTEQHVDEILYQCCEYVMSVSDCIIHEPKFLEVDFLALETIFDHVNSLPDGEARPTYDLFRAALNWVEHSRSARQTYIHRIINNIRFTTMTANELSRVLCHPMAKEVTEIKERVLAALVYIGETLERKDAPSPRITSMERWRVSPVVAFTYCGRLEFWTVPRSGFYYVLSRGAKAADGDSKKGGRGAIIGCAVHLEQGWRLRILVGGQSKMDPESGDSGGGGGTYVATDATQIGSSRSDCTSEELLVVSGGGGGTRGHHHDFNGCDAELGPSGSNGNGAPQERGLGGEKGEGGCCAPAHYGGGGGGYYSSGAGDGTEGANGYSLRSSTDAELHSAPCGGFGGGGGVGSVSGDGCSGGGGGGGYSGGGGGRGGGGGGSYVSERGQLVYQDISNDGQGKVEVWWGKQMPSELWKGKLEQPHSDKEDSMSQESDGSEASGL